MRGFSLGGAASGWPSDNAWTPWPGSAAVSAAGAPSISSESGQLVRELRKQTDGVEALLAPKSRPFGATASASSRSPRRWEAARDPPPPIYVPKEEGGAGAGLLADAPTSQAGFSPGDRVQVLPGKDFEGFKSGDRGTIKEMDQEAGTCLVAFDGRLGAPIRVACRYLKRPAPGSQTAGSGGTASASRSPTPPPLAASRLVADDLARPPLGYASLQLIDVLRDRLERLEERLSSLADRVEEQTLQQARSGRPTPSEEARLRELAERVEAASSGQLGQAPLKELADKVKRVEAALDAQRGEAHQREFAAYVEATVGQELTKRHERHIEVVHERLKRVVSEVDGQLQTMWARLGSGPATSLLQSPVADAALPPPHPFHTKGDSILSAVAKASESSESSMFPVTVATSNASGQRVGPSTAPLSPLGASPLRHGRLLPQPTPSESRFPTSSLGGALGTSPLRPSASSSQGARSENPLGTLVRLVDSCTESFSDFIREDRQRSSSPPASPSGSITSERRVLAEGHSQQAVFAAGLHGSCTVSMEQAA